MPGKIVNWQPGMAAVARTSSSEIRVRYVRLGCSHEPSARNLEDGTGHVSGRIAGQEHRDICDLATCLRTEVSRFAVAEPETSATDMLSSSE